MTSVASNFAQGVDVQVMAIGYPWATQLLKNYYPEDEPEEEPRRGGQDVQVRCPICNSEEVVFERLIVTEATEDAATSTPAAEETYAPIYKWSCDACGHQGG